MYWDMEEKVSKNKSDDRILVLKVMEGKKTVSSSGISDPRLVTGENRVHAVMDTTNMKSAEFPELLNRSLRSSQISLDLQRITI